MNGYVRSLLPFPTLLTRTGVLRPLGLTFYEDDVDDYSLEALDRQMAYQRAEIDTLHSFDRSTLSADARLSYDVMDFWLEAGLLRKPEKFKLHDYVLNQMSGIHTELPAFMLSAHPFDGPEYAGWYVDRVSKFGVAIDQVIEVAKAQEAAKIVPPKFILERIADDLETFTSKAADQNPLYTHFMEKTEALEGLAPDDREALARRLENEIANTVYPAWKRLATLVARLVTTATNAAGVWKLPDGDAYYAFRLLQMTTTKKTPEEIHALGLEKVGEIEAEIREILETQGYTVDNIGNTLRTLAKESRFLREDTPEQRKEVIARYQSLIDEIEKGVGRLFDLKPPVGVEVLPVPTFKEEGEAHAHYEAPPVDFSRRGRFFANLRGLEEQPTFGMRTVAYHEAIPGHHFQIAIALGQEHLPMFRRLLPFNSYAEGWALYAERLAAENGFQADPFDRVGYLCAQLFRAVRLVVDTGIHHKRWKREQAVQYMLDHSGEGPEAIGAEVNRYAVLPGQATGYMVGMLEILRLRDELRKRQGDAFDIKEFHNRVLENGGLPLFLLERVVLTPSGS